MSQKHKTPEPTGREYVDYTTKFCSTTIFYCLKLPERWENTILKPLIETAQQIEGIVVAANKIYINEKTMEREPLLVAYSERINELQKTIRLFSVFDIAFDRMMSYIDVAATEKKRLKNILLDIIQEVQNQDPNVKDIEIRVVSRSTDMEYVSMAGIKNMRLKLTRKGKDVWISAESDAIKYIRQRIEADKRAVNRLQKAA